MIILAKQIKLTIKNTCYRHKSQNHWSSNSSGSSTSMHKTWYQRSHPSHGSHNIYLEISFTPRPIPTYLFSTVLLDKSQCSLSSDTAVLKKWDWIQVV